MRFSAPTGELVVAGQFAGQDGQGFGAEVELQEELDLAVGLAPAAVGVGANQVPEVPGASGFGPPGGQVARGIEAILLKPHT